MLLLTRVPTHLAEVKSGTSGSEDGSLHVHTEIQTEMKERFNPTHPTHFLFTSCWLWTFSDILGSLMRRTFLDVIIGIDRVLRDQP